MKEEKDYIRFRTIIEVLGKPKKHIEEAIKDYVSQIKSDPEIMVLNENYSDATEQGDMFSIFVEIEMVVKDVPKLAGFCFDFMPSSLEIIKPDTLSIKNIDLSNILNDLQAKLHNVDMIAKKLKNEGDFLKRNLKISLKNNVMVVLAVKQKSDIGEISKLSGIESKELGVLLEELVKEEKIKKEGNTYSLK